MSLVLLPVVILAVALGLFRFLKATKPEQPPPKVQERVWRVAVEAVNPQSLAPELVLYGAVETPELLTLAASATAWVEQVRVRDGDRVAEQALLLQLDPRDFQPRIAQAQAEIDDLDAQIESENNRHQTDIMALEEERQLLELASQGVVRQQRLKTQKVGAEQALDEAKQQQAQQALAVSNREMSIADHPSRLRALQAKLASATAKLEQLELEYQRARLQAPYAAVIADVKVTAGDQVSRGDPLVTLYATASLEVRARIPAPHQEEIIAALNAGETLAATAKVAGIEVPLRLVRLAGQAAASGIDGYFAVQDHGELLRPGQLLRVRLERHPQPDIVAVPMAAVYGGERVYELMTDAEAVTRMQGVAIEMLGTRLGPDGQERALVRSPELSAGDQVVVTHMPNAVEGLRVEVVE
nr:biotin/lipoyl-binding protein [Rhabdochromatium marinum]